MPSERAFVYAVCGAAAHIRTLHRSLEYLKPHTALPIYVVTDSRRNEIVIEHATVIDVATPEGFDHHQASIYLKTSLHRHLPRGPEYVYIDTDVIAAAMGVDSIFDQQCGPITFAHDLNWLGNRVGAFSPWAMTCPCSQTGAETCSHLSAAIRDRFGIVVSDDWKHWNGGVFLFGPDATPFLDTWHSYTTEIFQDRAWKTRDQGTLIATVWTHGLQHQATLPPQYNFMIDEGNEDLRFERENGFALHASIPCIHPIFLHLYHAELDRPGWSLAHDVLEASEARSLRRTTSESEDILCGPALRAVDRQLRRAAPATAPEAHTTLQYRAILGVPHSSHHVAPFVRTLADGLRRRGVDLRVLFTEEISDTDPESASLIAPLLDVPYASLPVAEGASWGARWGTLIRCIEEASPCLYLPAGDWRHSVVSSQLSDRVGVVGILQGDPRDADELERIGRYWNGVVAVAAGAADDVARLQSHLAQRTVHLPSSWRERDDFEADLAAACEILFEKVMQEIAQGATLRPRGMLRTPPYQAGGLPVLPLHYVRGVKGIGIFPSYRQDYEDYRTAVGEPQAAQLPEWNADFVDAYPVLLGAPVEPDTVHGHFVERMLQGLQAMDRPCEVFPAAGVPPPPVRHFGRDMSAIYARRRRAEALVSASVDHIEERSPCLFMPNDGALHQAVCARLSDRVGIIGRVDHFDPPGLQRSAQLADRWNAVVAGDDAIAAELLRIKPSLGNRLVTIPLPVDLLMRLSDQPITWNKALTVAYRVGATSAATRASLAKVAELTHIQAVPIEWRPMLSSTDRDLFEAADVFLSFSAADADRWCIQEAMRRGCIPVLAYTCGLSPELLRSGENSYILADGTSQDFATRLAALQGNVALRRVIAAKAYTSACAGADVFRISYLSLFERVLREMEFGAFHRPVAPSSFRRTRRRPDEPKQKLRPRGHYA